MAYEKELANTRSEMCASLSYYCPVFDFASYQRVLANGKGGLEIDGLEFVWTVTKKQHRASKEDYQVSPATTSIEYVAHFSVHDRVLVNTALRD